MEDTTNWEFAALVAAICIGLGGLLLFTLIAIVGSWRLYGHAGRAAEDAARANAAVQDLARQLQLLQSVPAPVTAAPAAPDLHAAAAGIEDLRRQADALIDQQTRLQDAIRKLIEAGVLHGDARADDHIVTLEASVRRLEENLGRVAAAVANLGQRLQ